MGRNTLLSAGSTLLATLALVFGVVAVSTPYWATFEYAQGSERGHFGTWTVCRQRNKEYRCGTHVSRLQPSEYTYAAGVCGVLSVLLTAIMCVMSPVVLAMRVTRRQMFVKFRHAVLAKLTISCVAMTCCLLSLILFGIELDGKRLGQSIGYTVSRSWSFYLLVLFALISLVLCGFAAAEFVLARRLGGDPVKMARDPIGNLAPVIANPSAKEPPAHQRTNGSGGRPQQQYANGCGVAVIQSSYPPAVVFQRPANGGGDVRGGDLRRDVSDSGATSPLPPLQNGVPLAFDPRRPPLRSSLKKKKRREPVNESVDSGVMIIPNPGVETPPAARSKKVRIQTLDTPV